MYFDSLLKSQRNCYYCFYETMFQPSVYKTGQRRAPPCLAYWSYGINLALLYWHSGIHRSGKYFFLCIKKLSPSRALLEMLAHSPKSCSHLTLGEKWSALGLSGLWFCSEVRPQKTVNHHQVCTFVVVLWLPLACRWWKFQTCIIDAEVMLSLWYDSVSRQVTTWEVIFVNSNHALTPYNLAVWV